MNKGDQARKGRGRSAKRTALYDAMTAYADYFRPLLVAELAAEQSAVLATRDPTRPRSALVDAGVALFNLSVSKGERVFSNAVFKLSFDDGRRLPDASRFGNGDLLSLRSDAFDGDEEGEIEATLIERKTHRLEVAVPVASQAFYALRGLEGGGITVDVFAGTSAVAHERAVAALDRVSASSSEAATSLVRLLTKSHASRVVSETEDDFEAGSRHARGPAGLVPGIMKASPASATTATEWEELARETVRATSGKKWSSAGSLNSSQNRAVKHALARTASLIHGPPGTGKTATLAHVIAGALTEARGPVLAVAASNVAADGIASAFLRLGLPCRLVRVGPVAGVSRALWPVTLDGLLEKDASLRSARERALKSVRPDAAMAKAEMEATARIVKNTDVVVATCVGSGRDLLVQNAKFPFVVLDEAAQATETSALVAIALGAGGSARQLVLAGDHHQLPPTVLADAGGEDGLRRSLFLRLWQAGVSSTLLDTQYRMHPSVAVFASRHFYGGKVQDAVKEGDRPLPEGLAGSIFGGRRPRVLFVDVPGEETRGSVRDLDGLSHGFSYRNAPEADIVLSIVGAIAAPNATTAAETGKFNLADVGVVSPYAGQTRLLRQLSSNIVRLRGVEVATVDEFQGREKEAIVVTTVRCNNNGEVGFLADWRRLNVAITRARRLLVVVGNARTLRGDGNWGAWLQWVRKEKCRVGVREVEEAVGKMERVMAMGAVVQDEGLK